jgi:pyroglutamyl-peptidase
MRVVLVGFGPFPGAPFNPSAVLIKALAHRRRPAFAKIFRTVHVFATAYAAVDRDLPKLFARKPEIVLMFGLAGRRRHICIETRARNAVSVLFPDARGHCPHSGVIAPGYQAALRSAAPFAVLLGAARSNGLSARISHDAGRYLCNYAYWRALERAHHGRPLVQFIHIPPIRLDSRPRRRRGRRAPSFRALATAAESLLVALIAASRRQRGPRNGRVPNGARSHH